MNGFWLCIPSVAVYGEQTCKLVTVIPHLKETGITPKDGSYGWYMHDSTCRRQLQSLPAQTILCLFGLFPRQPVTNVSLSANLGPTLSTHVGTGQAVLDVLGWIVCLFIPTLRIFDDKINTMNSNV